MYSSIICLLVSICFSSASFSFFSWELSSSKVDNFSEIIGKLKIVATGREKELIKDDIGCNSVYTPYAFIDAENTIIAVARMVTDFIIRKDNFINQNWTIFGNLEENKSLINTKYLENDSYSVLKRDFDGNKLW